MEQQSCVNKHDVVTERAHQTFLTGADIILSRCAKSNCCESKVHCPFCDVDHFKPSLPARVKDHLNRSHFQHAVYLQGLMIVKCFRHCTHPAGHYHCPLCKNEILKRVAFTRHLISHAKRLGYASSVVQSPHCKQPQRILYENQIIQLCTESCKGSKGNHYHCPFCKKENFVESSTLISHVWRCQESRPKWRQVLKTGETIRDLLDVKFVEEIPHPRDVPYFKVWHKTVIRNLSDLPLTRCSDPQCCEGRYHCPLCPTRKLRPNYMGYIQIHLSSHLRSGVMFKEYYILLCYGMCMSANKGKQGSEKSKEKAKPFLASFHFHCPMCGTTRVRKDHFVRHLKMCWKRRSKNITANQDVPDQPADENDEKMNVCEDDDDAEEAESNTEDIEQLVRIMEDYVVVPSQDESATQKLDKDTEENLLSPCLNDGHDHTYFKDSSEQPVTNAQCQYSASPSCASKESIRKLQGNHREAHIVQENHEPTVIQDLHSRESTKFSSTPKRDSAVTGHNDRFSEAVAEDSDVKCGGDKCSQIPTKTSAAGENNTVYEDLSAEGNKDMHVIEVVEADCGKTQRGKDDGQSKIQGSGEHKLYDKDINKLVEDPEGLQASEQANEKSDMFPVHINSSDLHKTSCNTSLGSFVDAEADATAEKRTSKEILPQKVTATIEAVTGHTMEVSPVSLSHTDKPNLQKTSGSEEDHNYMCMQNERKINNSDDISDSSIYVTDGNTRGNPSLGNNCNGACKGAGQGSKSIQIQNPPTSFVDDLDMSFVKKGSCQSYQDFSTQSQILTRPSRKRVKPVRYWTDKDYAELDSSSKKRKRGVAVSELKDQSNDEGGNMKSNCLSPSMKNCLHSGKCLSDFSKSCKASCHEISSLKISENIHKEVSVRIPAVIISTLSSVPKNWANVKTSLVNKNKKLINSQESAHMEENRNSTNTKSAVFQCGKEAASKKRGENDDEDVDEDSLVVNVRSKCNKTDKKLLGSCQVLEDSNGKLCQQLLNLGTDTTFFPQVVTYDETLRPGRQVNKQEVSQEEERQEVDTVDSCSLENSGVSLEKVDSPKLNESTDEIASRHQEKISQNSTKSDAEILTEENHLGHSTCPSDIKMSAEDSKKVVNASYKCYMCEFTSNDFCGITVHLATEHKCSPPLTCDVCEEMFRSYTCLRHHLSKKHGPHPKTPFFSCPECGKSFLISSQRDIHVFTVHRNNTGHEPAKSKSRLTCCICDFVASSQFEMTIHRSSHKKKDIACKVCDKKFSKASYLQVHMEALHTYVSSCSCSVCGKNFNHTRYLTQHMKLHNGCKKHVCSICGWRFHERYTLRAHMETHKPKEKRHYAFTCLYCDAKYSNKTNFKDHLNKHTGDRPYKCHLCGKSYSFRSMLVRHKAYSHSNNKPYSCSVCHKAFRFNSKLQEHLVTHTGISNHICSICSKAFSTKSSLRQHIRKCKERSIWISKNPGQPSIPADFVTTVGNNLSIEDISSLLSTTFKLKLPEPIILDLNQGNTTGVARPCAYVVGGPSGVSTTATHLSTGGRAETPLPVRKVLLVKDVTVNPSIVPGRDCLDTREEKLHRLQAPQLNTLSIPTSVPAILYNADPQTSNRKQEKAIMVPENSHVIDGIHEGMATSVSGNEERNSVPLNNMTAPEDQMAVDQTAVCYICSACDTIFETLYDARAHILTCQNLPREQDSQSCTQILSSRSADCTNQAQVMSRSVQSNVEAVSEGPQWSSVQPATEPSTSVTGTPHESEQVLILQDRSLYTSEQRIKMAETTSSLSDISSLAQVGTHIVQIFDTGDARVQEYHVLSGKSEEDIVGLVQSIASKSDGRAVQIVVERNT